MCRFRAAALISQHFSAFGSCGSTAERKRERRLIASPCQCRRLKGGALNTITLTLVGLIAHVLTMSGVQRAVFVNAPMHDARIIVEATDVIETRGLVEETSSDPSQRVFAINGEYMTLDDGLTGPT